MYLVTLHNADKTVEIQIHGQKDKLESGKIVKGINSIDSFTFSMLPNNPGFNIIHEFTTLVTVYNTNRGLNDFIGRVLYAETTMDENGLITKTVTCESIFGYLCDSWQTYTEPRNWTVYELLKHLIDCHNSQVEEYKKFRVGVTTAAENDTNNNLYEGIQRENTWDAIKSKLLDKIGGELRFRIEYDFIYIDYLQQIGETKDTEIALSVNMKAITREQDPTAFVTQLIPLGCKLKKIITSEDEEGNVTEEEVETEERLDITSVNGGYNYISDPLAVSVYGIHVGVVEWDDVTTPEALLDKGKKWLKENNKVQIKYSITALDLSLIGLAIDDFGVGNTHPIKNSLLGIDDTARIIKKTIDICEEVESTIEIGDNFKTLSDIQREQISQLLETQKTVEKINHTTTTYDQRLAELNKKIDNVEEGFHTEIEQLSDSIKMEVNGSLGSTASIILSAGTNKYTGEFDLTQIRQAFANDNTAISISAGTLTFSGNTIIINSTNFTLDSAGKITANDATINGSVITIDGSFKTEMDRGSLRLYYSDTLCGTINTKYWSGASTEGISLRIEEGGNYIMFSHADDTQGSGYVVDYYLNAGWSSSYDEMHIFQTSARFLDDAYFAGKTRIRSLRLFDADGEYLVGINDGELTVSKL